MKALACLFIITMILTGCGSAPTSNSDNPSQESPEQENPAPPEITGYVMDQKKDQILVVAPLEPDSESNPKAMWVSEAPKGRWVGKQVEVWVKNGVRESFPSQAEAEQVTVLEMSQVEGADLEASEALSKALMEIPGDKLLAVKLILYLEEEDKWEVQLTRIDSSNEDLETMIADR
ncbi:hypothetical protein SAMN05216353_1438 [Halobacillus alkaliphilus]|uniref:DUF3221 domain-containing protein n=1 Tax=Halobacillus alkaliphilus TaxID=396056 RepID=A0A1I2RW11_9BACI|nr:DUF3221 domain-containing protein [Halobacillus alkaliphilus]SFG43699.1 hypothetical protein SAMN05216353_1438 [Halobacillus alkaliphilus]